PREGKDLEAAPPGDGLELARHVRLVGAQSRHAPCGEDRAEGDPRALPRLEAGEPLLELGGRGGRRRTRRRRCGRRGVEGRRRGTYAAGGPRWATMFTSRGTPRERRCTSRSAGRVKSSVTFPPLATLRRWRT